MYKARFGLRICLTACGDNRSAVGQSIVGKRIAFSGHCIGRWQARKIAVLQRRKAGVATGFRPANAGIKLHIRQGQHRRESAIVSIVVSMNISSQFPPTQLDSGSASHVLLSILAYSVITIAALQALLLAYQNNRLKHHHPGGLLSKLPPLQDMEALLFELLWAGQFLLSTAIVAGFLFFDNIWVRCVSVVATTVSPTTFLTSTSIIDGRRRRNQTPR